MFIVWKNNMFQRKMWVEIAALKLISSADDVDKQTPYCHLYDIKASFDVQPISNDVLNWCNAFSWHSVKIVEIILLMNYGI